jgi:hypothetical protein
MIIALWILNVLLALVFAWASVPKLLFSKEAVVKLGQKGVAELGTGAMRVVGVVELAAAIGLILPLLLDIAPILTPLAAVGLVIVMIGAAVVHVRRAESVVPNLVLALLAAGSAVLGFLVVLG